MAEREARPQENDRHGKAWSWWYCLLILPYIGTLWPPFYNSIEPVIAGFPFFYAYQMIWVGISAALTALVYFLTE